MMSGKLGDKVYSHWNGRPYVRSKAKKVRVPGTDAQRAHWEAFAAVSRLSSDLAEATLQLPDEWLPAATLHLYAFLLNRKGHASDTLYLEV